MKIEPTINLGKLREKASASAAFRSGVRSAIRGLWNGYLTFPDFVGSMGMSIRYGYTNAWHEGMQECGIQPSEMTPEESTRLETEINSQYQYMVGFAGSISQSSRVSGGKLKPLLDRGEMWANRYETIRSLAQQMACEDKKLKYVMHPKKEHCADCIRLNGRVYRASVWKKYDIYPRMRRLACGGFRCGCSFEITSDPATPGRPPNIG